MIGVMIVGMLMIGIMIPVSASEIEQEPSNATTASTSIISLNTTNLSIVEGDTFSLTATTQPSGLSVTWRSTNTTVATVSSSGIVTANKAGETLISASVVSNGSTYTSYCTVYVYIPTGIYYVKNYQSNYYLNVFQGRASNNTNVEQYGKYADSVSGATRTRQMWRINYLGNGVYSIRPLNKLDMGLYTNVNNVVIYNIGTTDTFSGVPYSMQWTIEWYSTGYIFRNDGHESLTMQVANSSTTSGANVIVGNYSDSLTCARWTLETVSSPPTGTFLYNTATGTAVSSSQEYVAPNETRTLSMFQLAPTFYSGETIDQQFYWYGNNSSVATVDESTGAITGVSPGTALITGLMDLDGYFYYVNYTVIVTEVANGTYYLKNKQTDNFADIYGPTMASGTTIQQWEFHGGNWQKWTFTHVGDGYYSIKSNNSTTPYYLGVKNDSSVVDTDIVLRSGSLTNGMKWIIEETTSGAYKLMAKTGEDYDYVLATSTSSSANGYKLIQGDYINNTSYRDEWQLIQIQYSATVYNYYDKGYCVRYGETETTSINKINSYIVAVSKRYLELFGLEIIAPTATYYESAIDTCKGNVNSSNIDTLCTHTNPHTVLFKGFNAIYYHFFKNTLPFGSNVISKAYWSGHCIQSYPNKDEYNRCYSSGSSIYMLNLSSLSNRDQHSKGILMHELNHQYGAPDHYHEILDPGTPNERCRGGELCSYCGNNPRPDTCIMYRSRQDISVETIICIGCKADMLTHLEGHH